LKKIPLEETLGGAYRFLFTNVVSIIGTAWLPFVLLFVLCGGLIYAAVPHEWLNGNFPQIKTFEQAIALVMPILALYPVILLLTLLMTAMVFTGLMEHALEQKTTPTFVYFSLGAPVWRMLGAFVLYYLVMVLLIAVLALLLLLAYLIVYPQLPQGGGIALLIVLGIVEFCFCVYAAVRLFFFLPAVVVAEDHIGLGRAWSLGGGNFWRIVVLLLMTSIPVSFVMQIVLQMTVLPMVASKIAKLQDVLKSGQPESAQIAQIFHAMLPVLPVLLAIILIERIAIMGLVSGAIGKAYIALTKPDAK